MGISLNNIITMTRGDTLEVAFAKEALNEYANYELQGEDTLFFGLMDPNHPFEEALIRKRFDRFDLKNISEFVLTFEPEETLDLLPGKYFYALKLWLNHPEVNETTQRLTGNHINKVLTLINKTKFIIID